MFTPATQVQTLQRKADIISAFTIIFGFNISIEKLRSIVCEWGDEQPALINPVILVHTKGWIPHAVGVGWKIPEGEGGAWDGKRIIAAHQRTMVTMPYLGIKLDGDNQHDTLFKETLAMINGMCKVIRAKKASANLKRCTAYLMILTAAAYRGRMGPWSLEKLQEWDRPLEKLYRVLGKWTRGHPRGLMYGDVDDTGEGYRRLSDWICELKFAALHRCMQMDDASRIAAKGLLLRACRWQRPLAHSERVTVDPIPPSAKSKDAAL